jgi:hypothetical protein
MIVAQQFCFSYLASTRSLLSLAARPRLRRAKGAGDAAHVASSHIAILPTLM